jgi:uncharacterized membrane protein YidH (DUF202 family)
MEHGITILLVAVLIGLCIMAPKEHKKWKKKQAEKQAQKLAQQSSSTGQAASGSTTFDKRFIVGLFLAAAGLALLIYGHSQYASDMARLGRYFGSDESPGLPWMIGGGVAMVAGAIVALKKLLEKKQ